MQNMSNLNKFYDSYQVMGRNSRLYFQKEKVQELIRNVQTNLFGSRFLPQTPEVQMHIKCMSVTKTKCPIVM